MKRAIDGPIQPRDNGEVTQQRPRLYTNARSRSKVPSHARWTYWKSRAGVSSNWCLADFYTKPTERSPRS